MKTINIKKALKFASLLHIYHNFILSENFDPEYGDAIFFNAKLDKYIKIIIFSVEKYRRFTLGKLQGLNAQNIRSRQDYYYKQGWISCQTDNCICSDSNEV